MIRKVAMYVSIRLNISVATDDGGRTAGEVIEMDSSSASRYVSNGWAEYVGQSPETAALAMLTEKAAIPQQPRRKQRRS